MASWLADAPPKQDGNDAAASGAPDATPAHASDPIANTETSLASDLMDLMSLNKTANSRDPARH